MIKIFVKLVFTSMFFIAIHSTAQDLKFKKILSTDGATFNGMVKDNFGVIWLSTVEKGLQKYDGEKLEFYPNNPEDPNSIFPGRIINRITIDAENYIWLTSNGFGLQRFDPATKKVVNFKHNPKDPFSLSNDTVRMVLEDHLGKFWVATDGGLDLLDKKSGKFTHYTHNPSDSTSIKHNGVKRIFEDKNGVIWVHTNIMSKTDHLIPSSSALNRYDRITGNFTRFFQDSLNPNIKSYSVYIKNITTIYEDRYNNFWLGTVQGLYNMDRATGKFVRYYPDPYKSSLLTQNPVAEGASVTWISFITEDSSGGLWLGFINGGMNRYDPITKKSTHFGWVINVKNNSISYKDTISGFQDLGYKGISSNEGLFWVWSEYGIFNLELKKIVIPIVKLSQAIRATYSFSQEPNGKVLWIATESVLIRKDLITQKEKFYFNKNNANTANTDFAFFNYSKIAADKIGNLWIATKKGLEQFNLTTNKFTQYEIKYKYFSTENKNQLSGVLNQTSDLVIDQSGNVWVTTGLGISKFDKSSGIFSNYFISNDSLNPEVCYMGCIRSDSNRFLWTGSQLGVFRFDIKTKIFTQYIKGTSVNSICIDSKGIVWAACKDGLYFFDKEANKFVLFILKKSLTNITDCSNIEEDNLKNLWVFTSSGLMKVNEKRDVIVLISNTIASSVNNSGYKSASGKLYFGSAKGYYSFDPIKINDTFNEPKLFFNKFKLGETELNQEEGGVLRVPLWKTNEIKLAYNQNVFSFDFLAIDYRNPGKANYYYKLENYNNAWINLGTEHKVSFYKVPPGDYTLKVKVLSFDGGIAEKSIHIIISPPWWLSTWAYILYTFLFILSGFIIFKIQKSFILKRVRERAQQKELANAKEIEKAYTELKSTQSQLIQSEKMASLGELTAGIAHEIQNPLNFVNNFSEVSAELVDEMNDEIDKGNLQDAKEIANDLKLNLEKINHHGKRAGDIVKGMLQHSRSSNGVKEPTDINALADEYLRLAYHGLRAKDKTFNATMNTDFDENIGNINIIPQDIGRVILNLITNAFYVVNEKAKAPQPSRQEGKGSNGGALKATENYEPTVWVTTKLITPPLGGRGVLISVKDNGAGIPQKIVDKIFQPFFTTKPTGQGTGLGLSLSYDIVKAHGGELKVDTKEGEGSIFIIRLPI